MNGKLDPELLEALMIRRGDQHFSQANAVSITQPTEFGTVYSQTEVARLAEFCKRHDLWLHIDGARFINAATALGCSLADVAAGADSISFGGTKNGLMFGEAVLFISERAQAAARNFPFIRKQLMQLPSKTRFIAAQFIELLGTDLWREISKNSCVRATQLRRGLEQVAKAAAPGMVQFTQKTEANAIFAIFERSLEKAIKKTAFFYNWNEDTRECRLMTSWNTTAADIERVIEVARLHTASAR